MSADNSVVVKRFGDGWRWAEMRGEIPVVNEDFTNGPFETCWDAQDDARDKIDVIQYGVDILRPSDNLEVADVRTVELHLAFAWICDDCGTDNYCRSISIELDEHQSFYERDRMGMSQEGKGSFNTMPKGVKCHSCGARFLVGRQEEDE